MRQLSVMMTRNRRRWKSVSPVQGTLNELIEGICVERALNYVAVNHAVAE